MPWWSDLVERGVAAYNSRDAEAFAAICTPDAELSPLVVQAEGGEPYRGDAGVRRWFEEIEAAFESVHIEVERVHDLGEVLVIEAQLRNRGRASGVEIVQVVEGGPADRAGLRPEDLIVELDGVAIEGMDELQRVVVSELIGQPVSAKVIREGQEQDVRIVPTELDA